MSVRITQVRVGSVAVGDVLHGYRVTGFGQSWIMDDEHNAAFGAEPGEQVSVCYAYGEPVQAAQAVAAPLSRADEIRAQIRRNEERMAMVGPRAARDLGWKNIALERELESL